MKRLTRRRPGRRHRAATTRASRARSRASSPIDDTVVVEGINLVKRHTEADRRKQPGGILEVEAPITPRNVMPVDPTTRQAHARDSARSKTARRSASRKSGARSGER